MEETGRVKGTEDKLGKICMLSVDFITATAEGITLSSCIPVIDTHIPSVHKEFQFRRLELPVPMAQSIILDLNTPKRESLSLTLHPSGRRIVPGP